MNRLAWARALTSMRTRSADAVLEIVVACAIASAFEALWLAAIVLGGLSFLNTWDFPIYLALFAAAVTLARLAWTGWRWASRC